MKTNILLLFQFPLKNPLHFLLTSFLLFFLFACQNPAEDVASPESEPAIDEEAIKSEILAVQKELFEAFKQGDYDKAFSMHLQSPAYRNISDRIYNYDETSEFMGSLKSQGIMAVEYQVIDPSFNILDPNTVIETANVTSKLEMEDGTSSPVIPGLATIVYQKIDGVWKLGHVHVTDFPPEE
jgi:hypothetical protein